MSFTMFIKKSLKTKSKCVYSTNKFLHALHSAWKIDKDPVAKNAKEKIIVSE